MSRSRLVFVIAVVIVGSVWPGAADTVDPAYQQSFDKWRTELVDDLKQNWLTLAGLFWLKPGQNSFGSDKSNVVVFPSGPAHAGSFLLQNDEVTVKFLPGIDARTTGKTGEGGKVAAGYLRDTDYRGDGKPAPASDQTRFADGHSLERRR